MEEKSFKPSKKKLERAQKEGDLCKSPLFTQSFGILSAILASMVVLPIVWVRWQILVQYYLISNGNNLEALRGWSWLLVMGCGSIILAGASGVILAESLQVGFRINLTFLAPKLSRIGFGRGLKAIVSGIKDLPQILLRGGILCACFYWFFSRFFAKTIAVLIKGGAIWPLLSDVSTLIMIGCGVLVVCGGVDYGLKRRVYFRRLSMSLSEMRKEHKEEEGDPYIKHQRNTLHRKLALEEVIERVRRAKVVVVERREEGDGRIRGK